MAKTEMSWGEAPDPPDGVVVGDSFDYFVPVLVGEMTANAFICRQCGGLTLDQDLHLSSLHP